MTVHRMRMAKVSAADLEAAETLAAALSTIEQGCDPSDEDHQHLNLDDAAACQRVLRHLLQVVAKTSLYRVVGGMSVLLDQRNEIVDPALDYLDLHPRFDAVEAERDAAIARAEKAEADAQALRNEMESIAEKALRRFAALEAERDAVVGQRDALQRIMDRVAGKAV